MILFPIAFPFLLFLLQSCQASTDDAYPETVADGYAIYPDDLNDLGDDLEVQRRSSHFLRFGRNKAKYESDDEGSYDDDYEEYARPTRRTEKNDHFIRFGRGKQAFLRFGRDPHRTTRDRTMYLRFGRSVANEETSSKRSKRETMDEKRSDAFLRFGRNSNFVRFGRNPSNINLRLHLDPLDAKELADPALVRLLRQMAARRQAEKQCASAA